MQPTAPSNTPLVLFTDLDGTLLDHHTYSADGALPTLRQLTAHRIPLVFCSSKTFAEQIYLQRQLGLSQPFILENGSGIAIPTDYFAAGNGAVDKRMEGYDIVSLVSSTAADIRATLTRMKGPIGFAHASDAALSTATGLSGAALGRARDRWFTETLLESPSPEQLALWQPAFERNGWMLSRGGRFYTIMDAGTDKGKAANWLAEKFRQNRQQAPLLAAIGDSPNDAALLAGVDYPYLVQQP
ncbi:MAG: HAD-IIB family hydrolase, partial [Saprospiraceae bacterium]